MPFASRAQRRFLFARHPGVAEEFAAKTPRAKRLPERVSKMPDESWSVSGTIAKAVRLEEGERRQNLVFGWANVPHPVRKDDHAYPSLEEELRDIAAAYAEQFPLDTPAGDYAYIVATFPDYVVVSRTERGAMTYLRHGYEEDPDGGWLFDPGEEVEQAWVAKEVTAYHKALVNSQPKEDLQGDVLELSELERAAYDFVLTSGLGDVSHDQRPVAKLVESFLVTDEKLEAMGLDADAREQVAKGWWLGFKVDDPTMDRVESGELAMFSIGGTGVRTPFEKHAEHDQSTHGGGGGAGDDAASSPAYRSALRRAGKADRARAEAKAISTSARGARRREAEAEREKTMRAALIAEARLLGRQGPERPPKRTPDEEARRADQKTEARRLNRRR